MKYWNLPVAISCIFLISCLQQQTPKIISVTADSTAAHIKPVKNDSNYFPVTAYLKGQIASIKSGNINPLQVVKQGSKTDSLWLKTDQIEENLSEFLIPVIDTVNMKGIFSQSSFLDQTINAFTFTYDPIAALPDSIEFKHWDVYIDPEKSTVSKVYLVKIKDKGKRQLQLTWRNNSSAKIISVINKPDGSSAIEKETTITWNFN